MYTIDKEYSNLIEIKKSKFITFAFPVETSSQIDDVLTMLSKEYRDATHICYAFVLSRPNLERACDNGEPDGTAGKPILDVIKKNNLQDILVVVIRYFGGIKLGAGGLLRAYSSSASEVIKQCRVGINKTMMEYLLSCDIKNAKNLVDVVRKNNVNIAAQSYSECFNLSVLAENMDFLKNLNFEPVVKEIKKVKVFYDCN